MAFAPRELRRRSFGKRANRTNDRRLTCGPDTRPASILNSFAAAQLMDIGGYRAKLGLGEARVP